MMSKRKVEKLFEEVKRLANSLGEEDNSLNMEQVRAQLRETGVDPDQLKARLHGRLQDLAKRERLANRIVSSSLKQAIETTRPDDEMPRTPHAAHSFVEKWLDKLKSPFVLPFDVETCRAYRKSSEISEKDERDLDQIERDFKLKVKRENER
jgi:hypothetical protein